MNAQITSRKSAALVATTALVALGYGAFCAAANAAPVSRVTVVANVPQVSVSFADLNLSSVQGAATLYQRIKAAASSACERSSRNEVDAFGQIRTLKCAQRAVRMAVKKNGAPLLIAVYNAHTSTPLPSRTILAQAQ
jgi:UrcA family protein